MLICGKAYLYVFSWHLIKEEHCVEDSEDMVPCLECGNLFPADELIDGLCPDCRELMETEMDWEDTEDY